jgi:hypothetical protein
MKTIGFIDYYIDEWHSNNYPAFFADTEFGKDFKVTLAYEVAPHPDRRPLDKWCKDMNIAPAASPEEVVDNCDCIMVLAPNNSEKHEELAEYALASGKPVYIDKTFAPGRAAAQRLFERAKKYNTPLMSSSALRYSKAVIECATPGECEYFCGFCGGLWFDVYAVHQVEQMVALCGVDADKVIVNCCGNGRVGDVVFSNGRLGRVNYDTSFDYMFSVRKESGKTIFTSLEGDKYFKRLMDKIAEFFVTGKSPIDPEQTCTVCAIVEALRTAEKTPGEWVKVIR